MLKPSKKAVLATTCILIRGLADQGLSYSKIALRLGLTKGKVAGICRRQGIECHGWAPKLLPEQLVASRRANSRARYQRDRQDPEYLKRRSLYQMEWASRHPDYQERQRHRGRAV